MPLKPGKSAKVVASNIKELMSSYRRTGKLGTSRPRNKKKAQKQAAAIALSVAENSPFRQAFLRYLQG